MTSHPFDLQRFVQAQDAQSGERLTVFERACREIGNGKKENHWMWFVFPQIAGLGFSSMSKRYAISSLEEAKAYLDHPVLGPRLRRITELAIGIEGRNDSEVFGSPDDAKFRSSMTLFATAAADPALFLAALRKYGDGEQDRKTLEILGT